MTRGRKLYSDVPLYVYINDDNKIAPLAYVCVCVDESVSVSLAINHDSQEFLFLTAPHHPQAAAQPPPWPSLSLQ